MHNQGTRKEAFSGKKWRQKMFLLDYKRTYVLEVANEPDSDSKLSRLCISRYRNLKDTKYPLCQTADTSTKLQSVMATRRGFRYRLMPSLQNYFTDYMNIDIDRALWTNHSSNLCLCQAPLLEMLFPPWTLRS